MNRINELRKFNRLSVRQLSSMLEIAESTLNYWQMGKRNPDHNKEELQFLN